MSHHVLHREGCVRRREAGKSAAVPVWNGRTSVACQGLERGMRTTLARQRAQHAVDVRAAAAAMKGVGENLANDLVVLEIGRASCRERV